MKAAWWVWSTLATRPVNTTGELLRYALAVLLASGLITLALIVVSAVIGDG